MEAIAKIKKKTGSVIGKVNGILAGIMMAIATSPVHALGEEKANFTASDPKEMIAGIIGLVLDVASYVGMVIAVYGVIKIILAYKDDNANEISNGVRFAVVGLALVAVRAVLRGMGFIS